MISVDVFFFFFEYMTGVVFMQEKERTSENKRNNNNSWMLGVFDYTLNNQSLVHILYVRIVVGGQKIYISIARVRKFHIIP